MTTADAHEFRDTKLSVLAADRYYSRCWCGWASREARTREVAKALHGEHVAYATEGPKLVRE
jgi:hypothetical protein